MTVPNSLCEDQAAIMNMVSSNMPLEHILNFIVSSIEKHCDSNRVAGSIMLHNPLSNQLAETISSSLPSNFINTIEPVNISPYGGVSGTAAFLKQPILVSDIEHNPLCTENRHVAIVYGIRACWASPLLSTNQELLGTIVMYSREVGVPTKEMLNIFNFFSQLASLVIEASKYQDKPLLCSLQKVNA